MNLFTVIAKLRKRSKPQGRSIPRPMKFVLIDPTGARLDCLAVVQPAIADPTKAGTLRVLVFAALIGKRITKLYPTGHSRRGMCLLTTDDGRCWRVDGLPDQPRLSELVTDEKITGGEYMPGVLFPEIWSRRR